MDIYKRFVFSNKVSQDISARGLSLPTTLDLPKDIYNKITDIFHSLKMKV